MAILPIIEAPDARLKQISAPVEAFDEPLRKLVADMFETMYAAPGIGLAAVQVGVARRVLVIDLQEREGEPEDCGDEGCGHDHRPVKREPRVFINPVVLAPSEEHSVYNEGCLSVPDIYAEVERPSAITLEWQDLDGAHHREEMAGLMATCVQHEMDHLEGVLFIDHLSRLKRQMALKKLEKARRAA